MLEALKRRMGMLERAAEEPKRQGGRKRLGGLGPRKQVHARVCDDLLEMVQAKAAHEQRSVSETVAAIIEEHFRREQLRTIVRQEMRWALEEHEMSEAGRQLTPESPARSSVASSYPNLVNK